MMTIFNEIDAQSLALRLEASKLLLIDVRNDDEVARGIIADALHIKLVDLPAKLDQLPTAETIVFYCHSGVRSAHAADFAASKGLKNVYNLTGGIIAWGKAGLPFVAKLA
jgi:rhodanese-related sulfurtransferase